MPTIAIMQFSFNRSVCVVLSLVSYAQSLNILVNNDDGWAAANIREFYRLLKKNGHNVLMVAPVVDNSGQGGRVRVLPWWPLLSANIYRIGCIQQLREPSDRWRIR